ncbi:MAG: DNA-directed RNA polymerase subunit alpha C-terminal domain-containing protein [bacterium]|jgi:DNA-directed RNA polymerase alpha subunit|nr:DNA-directed RNA polymerase subunit alpha C-terminal domain-containing protein [bacterium]
MIASNHELTPNISYPHPILDLKIEHVPGFSWRSSNALRQYGELVSIHDLILKNDPQLISIRLIGRRQIANIKAVLRVFGLRTGMTDAEIDQMREGTE